MNSRHKKILLEALILDLLFVLVVVTAPGSVPLPPGSDPASWIGLLISLALFFVLAVAFAWSRHEVARWWRTRHSLPPPPASPSVESFRWSGRPVLADKRRSFGVLGVFAVMLSLAFLAPTLSGSEPPLLLSVLAVFLAAFLVLFILGLGFWSRTMAFEVDERGVRTRGMRRASFDLRWEEVTRIEFLPMEKNLPFSLFDGEARPRLPRMRMYAFLGLDGEFLAGFPIQMLSPGLSNSLESALLAQASRHGIPVVEVRWRDSFRWRKRKARRGGAMASAKG